ncbi:MAG: hypothetical protein N4Q25_06640 [Lactobacillus crispatus]|nr:hypothetical protein [Lactobacillus crispatus]MCT7860312.1 hypothetical protein [Lactobacillus crispatus]
MQEGKVYEVTKITFAKDGRAVKLDANIFDTYVQAVKPLVKYVKQKENKVKYKKGHISSIEIMDDKYSKTPKYAFTISEKTVYLE